MGRKIRGKKHRGVKDPEEQHKRVLERTLKKKNNVPQDPSQQEIPRKVKMLMESKLTKPHIVKGKKKRKVMPRLIDSSRFLEREVHLPGMKKPLKPVPVLKQMPGESARHYMTRVHYATKDYIKHSKLEVKYKVAVIQDPVTGRIQLENDGNPQRKKSKAARRKKRRQEAVEEEGHEAEVEEQWSKHRKGPDNDDFCNMKDEVKFGEVVSAPPQLTARPRNAPKTKIISHFISEDQATSASSSVSTGPVNRTVKRKLLPVAERRQLEAERERVQQAYRNFRAQKWKKM